MSIEQKLQLGRMRAKQMRLREGRAKRIAEVNTHIGDREGITAYRGEFDW